MHPAEKPFHHVYEAAVEWPGQGPAVTTAGPRPAIVTGPPPEFGGEAEWWSPEHLLVSAAANCLMATFGAMARAKGLRLYGYRGEARAVLEKTPGGLAFTSIALSVALRTEASDAERARELLLKAKQRCIVANVLVLPVQLDVTLEPVAALEAVGA
jgi:organic hydroperoxide reductase OsmC/OhrA